MNLYRRIDRTRLQFDFLYFTQRRCDYDAEIEASGGVIHRLPTPRHPVERFRVTLTFLRSQRSFQAVHVHDLFDGGIYLLAARMAGIGIRVAHAHATSVNLTLSVWGRRYQRISRWLASVAATEQVACGQAAGEFVFGKGATFSVLPNGIDLTQFHDGGGVGKNYLRELLDLDEGSAVLCQISRLSHQKNPHFTLEVAEALHQRGYAFHLIFAGEGKLRRALEVSARDKGLGHQVSFLGSRHDIPQIMRGADALLLPSRYEGFPVVLVESQAVGLTALVSTRVSREVDLGLNSIQFLEVDSPHRWAAAIEGLPRKQFVSPQRRQEIIREAGYGAGQSAERLTAIYRLPF